MRGLVRRVSTGERGFTLIELLVVVAILGIIAAVVVLNIGGFLGRGAEEAANTEAHQVQTAVIAYMTETSATTWGGTVGPTDAGAADHPAEFLLNPARLQAIYTVEDGVLASAIKIDDSRWGDLVFAEGSWGEPPPAG